MGAQSSRPLLDKVDSVGEWQEETISFDVSSVYRDDREENVSIRPCFFLSRPPTFRLNPLERSPMVAYSEERKREHESLSHPSSGNPDALKLSEPLFKSKGCESVASTASIETWSLKSLEGSVSISSTKRRSRRLDIYQTDATMIFNEEDEDWSPLVFVASLSRLQLPFRPCARKLCTCKKINSNTKGHLSHAQHLRQMSDDLQGLWIPHQVEEVEEDDVKELRWMLKAHSERNLCSCKAKNDLILSATQAYVKDCAANSLEKTSQHGRTRAASEDLALQQQPPLSPPSPGRRGMLKKSLYSLESIDSSISAALITRAIPLTCSSSMASQTEEPISCNPTDNKKQSPSYSSVAASSSSERQSTPIKGFFSETNNVAVSTSQGHADSRVDILDKNVVKNRAPPTFRRLRSRSEDLVDMPSEGKSSSFKTTIAEKKGNPQQPPLRCPVSANKHRQRARSEDVIDQRFSISCGIPTELVVEPPLSDEVTLCSSTKHSRSGVREVVTPKFKTSTNSSSHSPTSVIALPERGTGTISRHLPPKQSTQATRYLSTLQELRASIEHSRHLKEQNKVIELYQGIAWLHFQNARFDAARCVINHALELLYATEHRGHGCTCLTLEEALTCVKDSRKRLLAQLLLTKAQILLLADDGDKLLSCREAKYLSEISLSLIQPMSDLLPDLMLMVAESFYVLGKTFFRDGLHSPGAALGSFEQALSIFRFLSQQPDSSKKCGIWIAETLVQVGNLHVEQRFFDLAKDSFWEALGLYRLFHQQNPFFLVVDMAMTLTNLGWIHLLENDVTLAHQSTMEALWLLQCHFGDDKPSLPGVTTVRSLRNLASVEYQLGMIASQRGETIHALAYWKAALWHQQAAFRAGHTDIAVTMEVIGASYQQLCKWSKAKIFLEGALAIRKQAPNGENHLGIARIQSRLALVLLEMNDPKRAERFLFKAMRRYRQCSLPLDDLGQEARLWLLHARDIKIEQN